MGEEQATAYIEHIIFLDFDPNKFPDLVYKVHYAINIVLYHICRAIYALGLGYGGILYYLNYNVLRLKYTTENLAESLQQVDKEAEEKGYTTADTSPNNNKPAFIIKNEQREKYLLNLNNLLNNEKIFLKTAPMFLC